MNKQKTILVIGGAIILLLGLVVTLDSTRVLNASYAELKEQDDLIRGYEEKYITTTASLGVRSLAYLERLETYREASSITDRREQFDVLVSLSSQESISKVDVSNPVSRRLGDELSGALNRRKQAEKRYEELLKEYRALRRGLRGTLASFFTEFPDE